MSSQSYNSFVSEILTVIVLYKTDICQSKSFNSLLDILKETHDTMTFLIYDNSPESSFNEENYQFLNTNIYYIHDKNNSGVSKAYNEGFKLTKKLNKKWILLADQDTFFSKDFLSEYFQSILTHPEIHLFVPMLMQDDRILSPCKFIFKRGSSFSHFSPGLYHFNKISVLNSGMLISTESFAKAGGFNEKIKLDFADFYFIDKYKRFYHSFVVTHAVCIHELSSFEKDIDKILSRFKFYCNGARLYSENIFTFAILFIIVFYRTIRFSFMYKNILFIKLFIKYFMVLSIDTHV